MNFYDELLTDKPEDKTYPEITAPGLLNAIVKEISEYRKETEQEKCPIKNSNG